MRRNPRLANARSAETEHGERNGNGERTPHADRNGADQPSIDELLRSGQEPVVVNLDIPVVEKPEEVHWVDNIHPAPKK